MYVLLQLGPRGGVYVLPVGLTKGRYVCFTGSSWFDQGEVCMFYWLQLV